MIRTVTLADGTIIKSHPLFRGGSCRKHSSCGCFNNLQRRFDQHLAPLLRAGRYEEVERKRRKFSTLIAHEYAFPGRY